MREVIYSSPFVPAEWIAVHGLHPRRIVPGPMDGSTALRRPVEGVCPFARAFAHTACTAPGNPLIVMSTECDQMRRIAEWVETDSARPVFVLNVPATWENATPRAIYESELHRLGRFLRVNGGTKPADGMLESVMTDVGTRRDSLRAARAAMDPRRFAEELLAFHADPAGYRVPAGIPESDPHGVPLAIVGSPLPAREFAIHDVVARAGGRLVLDATAAGEMTLPESFNPDAVRADAFAELVRCYFGSIPDAFRRPNARLYEWLEEQIPARRVAGIILKYETWCDTWHGEAQRMREWARVPLLAFQSADGHIDGHAASRIEAFLETLR